MSDPNGDKAVQDFEFAMMRCTNDQERKDLVRRFVAGAIDHLESGDVWDMVVAIRKAIRAKRRTRGHRIYAFLTLAIAEVADDFSPWVTRLILDRMLEVMVAAHPDAQGGP